MNKLVSPCGPVASFLILSACGGGGGGSSPPPPPPPPPVTYTVAGAVAGLNGSVVLQNNGGNSVTVNANGNFAFTVPVNAGTTYSVSVQTQPTLQSCAVTSAAGTANANVTNVAVACTDKPLAATLVVEAIKHFRFGWNSVSGATRYRLMEDITGTGSFAQAGGDLAASATTLDRITALHTRARAHYRIEACDANNCIASNEIAVSGDLAAAVGFFKASNTGANDEFGASVAISADGNTLAVGAPREAGCGTGVDPADNDNCTGAGAVYVYIRNGAAWQHQAYLKPEYTTQQAAFGWKVALSADGNRLAASAIADGSDATGINGDPTNNDALYSGAVYLFERTGAAWAQATYVKAPLASESDAFGSTLAMSGDGNTLAVGAWSEDGAAAGINGDFTDLNAFNSGAAYVYAHSGGAWSLQAYVKASNPGMLDEFGNSLALSLDGNTLAVGAHYEDGPATGINGSQIDAGVSEDSGAAYVFTRSGTTWTQQAYVKAINTGFHDYFGTAVALSPDGSTLAASSHTTLSRGEVNLYTRDVATWSPQTFLWAFTAESGDVFGQSLALADGGNLLVVGTTLESSNAIGIGGAHDNNLTVNSGAAYSFTRSGATWSQGHFIKAPDTEPDARFGTSLALTPDGTTLVVGAMLEASAATLVNGNQTNTGAPGSGAAYVY